MVKTRLESTSTYFFSECKVYADSRASKRKGSDQKYNNNIDKKKNCNIHTSMTNL